MAAGAGGLGEPGVEAVDGHLPVKGWEVVELGEVEGIQDVPYLRAAANIGQDVDTRYVVDPAIRATA